MIVPTPRIFSSANSIEYLVSMGDDTMPLKELKLPEVRLLSTRFYVLATVTSLALTSGPSEVLSVRESHNLRDSNSLKKGVGFNLLAKGMVSPYDTVEEIYLVMTPTNTNDKHNSRIHTQNIHKT
ncbi:hypothetical protein Tco_0365459 [Tanacetum coccineum]